MQAEELLITWIVWSISWIYLAEVVKKGTAQPSKVSLPDDEYFEVLALNLSIIIEKAGFNH